MTATQTQNYILNAQGFITSDGTGDFDTAYAKALDAFGGTAPNAKDLINLTEYLRANATATPVAELEGAEAYNAAPIGTVVQDPHENYPLLAVGEGRWYSPIFNGTTYQPGDISAKRPVVAWGATA